jgi:hypothetical protein
MHNHVGEVSAIYIVGLRSLDIRFQFVLTFHHYILYDFIFKTRSQCDYVSMKKMTYGYYTSYTTTVYVGMY